VATLLQFPAGATVGLDDFVGGFGIRDFEIGAIHFNFWPVWEATLPSKRVSVTVAENSKLPPGFVLPPFAASSHSRRFLENAEEFWAVAERLSFSRRE